MIIMLSLITIKIILLIMIIMLSLITIKYTIYTIGAVNSHKKVLVILDFILKTKY
jgi:hypothetical protein